ncbi:hypothetical protein [Polyangium jinanense]|uniref:Uncharacterized protein n=1 Tax=Polyangium jinanense TaxID=2829994 RepID=A0A9X4AV11_9BACT|nr:hypothetical protein [Polyangium jinanense]MDC3959930.1 hypothetical protein [Polyangium jinanense]MDC3983810.1 hypothetical protein [Polyangium jinanense]
MRSRVLALTLAGCGTWLGSAGVSMAAEPEARGSGATTATAPAGRGAVVVAIGSGVEAAAKPLAREIYRDEALRPSLDDRAARVLAGEAVAADAPAKERELAEVRSALTTNDDAPSRRLLASLGAEQKAEIVVAVSMAGDRPVARVLRVGTARYESIELGPTIERSEAGEIRYTWPGAAATLRKLVIVPQAAAPAPLAPKQTSTKAPAKPEEPTPKPFYKSAWFWGPVGAIVAAGAAVLITSKVTEDSTGMVRLRGQVAP